MGIDAILGDVYNAFTQARPEGWFVIIAIIIPISIYAFYQLWNVQRHLKAEFLVLSKCQDLVPVDIANDEAETAIERWLSSAPKDSLVTRATRALWKVRGTPNPDLEAISTLLDQSEVTRLSFARAAPNLLLLAGLLGTVIGLAGSISTLGPQVQNTIQIKDPTELTRNLGVTLQHMQTAFTCTLWGILMAIFVAMTTRVIASKQSDFLSKVQEFMIYDLVPRLIPETQVAQLNDISRVLAAGQNFLDQVSEKMATASEKFEEVLSRAGAQMTDGLSNLHTLTADIQSSLLQASFNVQDSAKALISSSGAIEESTRNLKDQHTDLRNAYTNLQSLFDESRRSLEQQISEQLTEIGKLREDFSSSTLKVVSQVGSASERLQEAVQAFHNAGEQYLNTNVELRNNISSHFEKLAESISKALDEHEREVNRVEENLRLMNDRLSEMFVRLDPRLLPEADWSTFKEAVVNLQEILERETVVKVASSYGGLQEQSIVSKSKDSGSGMILNDKGVVNIPTKILDSTPTVEYPRSKRPWWQFWR